MKENIINFLSFLEGYHQRLKELHWSTTCKAEHLLTDDIDGSVLEYEDKIAEVAMGLLNVRFDVGELKTLIPDGKTLKDVLAEMEKDILKIKGKITDDKSAGLQNIFDDFMEDVEKWKYLETFS